MDLCYHSAPNCAARYVRTLLIAWAYGGQDSANTEIDALARSVTSSSIRILR